MASALALKRLFWRKVKRVNIVRINKIVRADNLAFVRLLNLKQQHIQNFKTTDVTKWAIVDSQPDHHESFSKFDFDIIIDHHPVSDNLDAAFIDIQEDYGANSTILTEYLKASRIKPSPSLATALFYGIKNDTNSFVRNTVSNDIKAFRYLYEYANLNIIKKIESSEMLVFAATPANWQRRCSEMSDPPVVTKVWPELKFPSSKLNRMLKK
jgi:nanoRNase/pAp phosphatase (c-di-AMP/oligoRNAs hydrolase)